MGCGTAVMPTFQMNMFIHVSLFRAEEQSSTFLRKVGVYLQVHMTLQLKRPTLTSSQL
jgi:hypothetical protein